MIIDLTKTEMATARKQSDDIQERKREAGIQSRVYHDDTALVNAYAIYAETAFAKFIPGCIGSPTPVLEDGSPNPYGNDGGWDWRMPSGLTVDVKSTLRDNPKDMFIMTSTWPPKADVYVFCKVLPDTDQVQLIGWAWGEDIEDRAKLKKLPKGEAYTYPVDRLTSMTQLFREAKR